MCSGFTSLATVFLTFLAIGCQSHGACRCCLFAEAYKLSSAGKVGQAAEVYSGIVGAEPTNAQANFCYAQVLHSLGRAGDAKKYYTFAMESAVASGSKDCFFSASLGKAHLDLREYPEAIKQFKIAESLCPDDPLVLRELTWLMAQVGDKAAAETWGQKALTIDSKDLVVLEDLIYVEIALRKFDQARDYLRRFEKLSLGKNYSKLLKAKAFLQQAIAEYRANPQETRKAIELHEERFDADPIENFSSRREIAKLRDLLSSQLPARQHEKLEVGHWVSGSGKTHFFFSGSTFHFCEMFTDEAAKKLSELRGMSIDKSFCGRSPILTYLKAEGGDNGTIRVSMSSRGAAIEEVWTLSNGGNKLTRQIFASPPRSISENIYYVDPIVSANDAGLRFID